MGLFRRKREQSPGPAPTPPELHPPPSDTDSPSDSNASTFRSFLTRRLSFRSGTRSESASTSGLAGGTLRPSPSPGAVTSIAASQPNLPGAFLSPETAGLGRRPSHPSITNESHCSLLRVRRSKSVSGADSSLSPNVPAGGGALAPSTAPAMATTNQGPLTPSAASHANMNLNTAGGVSNDIMSDRYTAWRKAFDSLDEDDRKVLEQGDLKRCLRELKAVTEEKKKECDLKRWTYTTKNGTVALGDIAGRLINWIDRFARIGDLAAQYDPVHAALPWAGFRFLLTVATIDQSRQNTIMVTLERLAMTVDRCAIYECLYVENPQTVSNLADELEKSLVSLYTNILLLLAKSKGYFSHNTPTRILLGIFEDDPKSLLSTIKEGEDDVHRLAEVLNMEYGRIASNRAEVHHQALRSLLEGFDEPMRRIESNIDRVDQVLTVQKKKELLEWISSAPYMGHHNRAKEDRLPGSCKWLVKERSFRDWRARGSSSLFWLHGIPGAGKTKIVSSVIDKLLKRRERKTKGSLAFFYCNRNELERQTPEAILSSIARQLTSTGSSSKILQVALDEYEKEASMNFPSGPFDVRRSLNLILNLLPFHTRVTIVIDALDECDRSTRCSLIAAIRSILQSPSIVRIFISSREDSDIVRALKDLPNLSISAKHNQADIERYVHSELDRRIESGDLLDGDVSEDLKSHIRKVLIDKSDGMFMWVNLQIKELCDSDRFHTEADVIEELGKLPIGLEETYNQIFKVISSYPRESSVLTKRALQWIMCALRPLHPQELIDAILTPSQNEGPFSQSLRLTKEKILQLCHNLVIYDQSLDVMRLAHLSVLEYLEKEHWTTSESHALAAETCLRVVLALPRTGRGIRLRGCETYALHRWPHHISLYDRQHPKDSEIVSLLEKVFYVPRPGVQSIASQWHRFSLSPHDSTNMGIAIHHNFTHIVRYQIGLGRGIEHERHPVTRFNTLHLAVYHGHEELCRLLINCGVLVNARSHAGGTPLMLACRKGHVNIVKLLLDNGAVLAPGPLSTRDLATAYSRSDKTILKIYIRHMESQGQGVPEEYRIHRAE